MQTANVLVSWSQCPKLKAVCCALRYDFTIRCSALFTPFNSCEMVPARWGWGPAMRYTMMQLFLTRRVAEGDLLSLLEPAQTRKQYLDRVFAKEVRFQHYNRPHVYKPFPMVADRSHIVGVIGKEHTITVAGPPEESFVPKPVEDWETANLLLDPSETEQRAAMQAAVGSPLHIFRSLVDYINLANPDADWTIMANAVTRTEQFWSAVERNKGHIAEIDLSFVVPNIWGGSSETEKALKDLKEKNNAQEVEIKIKNKDGQLVPDSDRVRESVDYITKGGGEVQLRDENQGTIYSSDHEESIVTVPIEPDYPVQGADTGMIASLIQRLFGGK